MSRFHLSLDDARPRPHGLRAARQHLRAYRKVGALLLPGMVIDWLAEERRYRPKRRRHFRLAELLPWNYSPYQQ
jgi:hypothetical protein